MGWTWQTGWTGGVSDVKIGIASGEGFVTLTSLLQGPNGRREG
ncbi:MAG: hypothetical protein JWR19_838 [Pedosphaera sp.]|nr:hypothetical protein [Pedosphaera sp.]